MHTRQIRFQGFEREDGLWDIEGELLDTKPHAFEIEGEGRWEPEQPIHHMRIRVTLDNSMVVQDIVAVMDSFPHAPCPQAEDPMRRMIGSTMGRGWRQAIEQHLGGIQGCTHLRELLFAMATAAFQTRSASFAPPADGRPRCTWANVCRGTSTGRSWKGSTPCFSTGNRRPHGGNESLTGSGADDPAVLARDDGGRRARALAGNMPHPWACVRDNFYYEPFSFMIRFVPRMEARLCRAAPSARLCQTPITARAHEDPSPTCYRSRDCCGICSYARRPRPGKGAEPVFGASLPDR
ncbi:MAG: DUF2889 domain-containing protein [Burkholderiaceae bacterium]